MAAKAPCRPGATARPRRPGGPLPGGWGGDDPGGTGPEAARGPPPVVGAWPAGFAEAPVPADNPLTVEGVALGKRLFFNPLLSVDSTVACAR